MNPKTFRALGFAQDLKKNGTDSNGGKSFIEQSGSVVRSAVAQAKRDNSGLGSYEFSLLLAANIHQSSLESACAYKCGDNAASELNDLKTFLDNPNTPSPNDHRDLSYELIEALQLTFKQGDELSNKSKETVNEIMKNHVSTSTPLIDIAISVAENAFNKLLLTHTNTNAPSFSR